MKIIFALFAFLFVFLSPKGLFAQDAPFFEFSGNFTYEILSSGEVKVREEIYIKNLTTEKYSPSFTFDISGFSPENLEVYENGLATKTLATEDNKYDITFKRPALGKGANKTVVIQFIDRSLASKQGEVLEVRIPRIKNVQQYKNITTTVRISSAMADSFHIFPAKEGVKKKDFMEYTFSKSDIENSSITGFLGNVASYDFTLNYPFVNNSFFEREVGFAIPPDTAFQKVFIDHFSEEPETLEYDSDGNWIGKLSLSARSSKTFKVKGTIFVYAKPREEYPKVNIDSLNVNTKPQVFWESDSLQIKNISKELKTPREIYDYVVKSLDYDHAKTTRPQERLGALGALAKTKEAICMEFTDLFIALARASNIPAREVNGFAISTDSLHPRGLGEDILHSWPEYWDSEAKIWIPVDPTWGKTTNGVDYFSHFDLNHMVFVIHGSSSTSPQTPGTYEAPSSKEDLIEIVASKNALENEKVEPILSIENNNTWLWSTSYKVTVKNQSGVALYNVPVKISGNGVLFEEKNIVSILPFSSFSFTTNFYTGFFGNKLPTQITVSTNSNLQTIEVSRIMIIFIHFGVMVVPFVFIVVIILGIYKKYANH